MIYEYESIAVNFLIKNLKFYDFEPIFKEYGDFKTLDFLFFDVYIFGRSPNLDEHSINLKYIQIMYNGIPPNTEYELRVKNLVDFVEDNLHMIDFWRL